MIEEEAPSRQRSMPSMEMILDYWLDAAPKIFPEIRGAGTGWGEPFCFRCGWLAPIAAGQTRPWREAKGWLQRAHLRDHVSGGPDKPENLVPLCDLCHHAMPPFGSSRPHAIAWVRRVQPISRPWWWQMATDARWGGEAFREYPGWRPFFAYHVQVGELMRRTEIVSKAELGALLTDL